MKFVVVNALGSEFPIDQWPKFGLVFTLGHLIVSLLPLLHNFV